MLRYDARKEFDRLQAFYADADALAEGAEARLFAQASTVSGWSIAQHLVHCGMANGMMLKAITHLCTADVPPNADADGPTTAGHALLRLGRLPRGRAQAPDAARPPEAPTRDDVRSALHRNRERLSEVETYLPRLPGVPGRLPHPLLGMFNALQWLRFVRIHADHHQAIIEDILAAAAPRPGGA